MALDIITELKQNFIEYAVAVNTDRSIPDAKSGLKPVARRILWGAFDAGRTSSKPHVKNARIVGEVMGSWHPHGDSSIYGALTRLSQPWVMRYPLIDFHGNQGNICGDGPAAMRYTEGRLSKLAEDGMLRGIKKHNVDFVPNYSDDANEPITLPSIFPNLLCNPNNGVGVAMACNWGCHNLKEVKDAIFDYMDGKEPMLPGPDFPTGGIVINKNDFPEIMRTGRGSVQVRAKYKIDGKVITITEIPYGTTVENLIKEIATYAEENDCNITDIRDNTSGKGVAITIVLNKKGNPAAVIQKLFAKTNLQTSFSYNQIALIDKVPTEMNLEDCCKVYVEHNIECIVREAKFDLDKALSRLHIVEGLLKALEDIDNIVALIRKSASANEAKTALINKYKFSIPQAEAILNMKLAKLANLEKVEIQNEKTELQKTVEELEALISSDSLQKDEVKQRLEAIVKKFGDERKTELMQIETSKEDKEIATVIPEKSVVIMTEGGLIKRVPADAYEKQRRNGKGVKSQDDIVHTTIRTNTIDDLMIFSNKGKMYRILVDNIPIGTKSSPGVLVEDLVKMSDNEKPTLIYSIYRETDAKYVIFVTKNGLIKKTALEEYTKTKSKSGIAAISLREDDELVSVNLIKDENVILITKNGMSIRFKSDEISPSGRATYGMKGITLKPEDEVVCALIARHDSDDVAIFSQNGLGKKFPMKDLNLQKKAGKGLICYKPTEATGCVVGAALVEDKDSILISGKTKSICISASEIPLSNRGAIGNQLIKNNKVKSITKV